MPVVNPRPSIAWAGDSFLDLAAGWGVPPEENASHRFQRQLDSEGYRARSRNFANSGATTLTCMKWFQNFFIYDDPEMVVIWASPNDIGTFTQAETQANLESMILGAKHRCMGSAIRMPAGSPYRWANTRTSSATTPSATDFTVSGVSDLPLGARQGQRYVVINDGNSHGQSVYECRRPTAGASGWSLIALSDSDPTVCRKIVIVNNSYRLFLSGGDQYNTPLASTQAIRNAQAAAVVAQQNPNQGRRVTDPWVVLADLYQLQRRQIQTAVVTDPVVTGVRDWNTTWHTHPTGDGDNQHHNRFGHWLAKEAVRAAMPDAWLTDFE